MRVHESCKSGGLLARAHFLCGLRPRLTAGVLVFFSAGALSAHPLDDKADMRAQVRVASDSAIELALEFRYRDAIASYTEFRNGLDRDGDGTLTRDETRRRSVELAHGISPALSLSLNGAALAVEPDFSRFEFRDLDNPDADPDRGIDTSTARIMYRFVYGWSSPAPLTPGEHEIRFFLNSAATLVHSPQQQFTAIDAAGNPLPATYDLAMQAFPRMTARFTVAPQPAAAQRPPPAQPTPDAPQDFGELPAWLTLAAGAAVALFGIALLAVRARQRGGGALTGVLLIIAGAGIALGSLVRMRVIELG